MGKTDEIYVQLLDEGTIVYRPVFATRIGCSKFLILNHGYDPNDEIWEFPPGITVYVEEKEIEGITRLLAIRKCSD